MLIGTCAGLAALRRQGQQTGTLNLEVIRSHKTGVMPRGKGKEKKSQT